MKKEKKFSVGCHRLIERRLASDYPKNKIIRWIFNRIGRWLQKHHYQILRKEWILYRVAPSITSDDINYLKLHEIKFIDQMGQLWYLSEIENDGRIIIRSLNPLPEFFTIPKTLNIWSALYVGNSHNQ